MLNGNSNCMIPDYLNKKEINEICAFFQGAVYTWCAINGSAKFAARNFIGGINYYWEGTPLYKLYKHYESEGYEDPEKNARLDAGSLLKKTLSDDKRSFKQLKNDDEQRNYYEWDKQVEFNQMIDEETKKTTSELVNAIIKEKFDKMVPREINETYETKIDELGQNKEKGYIGRFFDIDIKDKLSIWAGYDPNPDYGFNVSFSFKKDSDNERTLKNVLQRYDPKIDDRKLDDKKGDLWFVVNLNVIINNTGNIQIGGEKNSQKNVSKSSTDSKSKVTDIINNAISIISSVLKTFGLFGL